MTETNGKHHERQQLAQVQMVRDRVRYLVAQTIQRLRVWMSMTGENVHVVDALNSPEFGMRVIAIVSDALLVELGDNAKAVDETSPDARRAVTRAVRQEFKPLRGQRTAERRGEGEE